MVDHILLLGMAISLVASGACFIVYNRRKGN
jgi:hypothetical protein